MNPTKTKIKVAALLISIALLFSSQAVFATSAGEEWGETGTTWKEGISDFFSEVLPKALRGEGGEKGVTSFIEFEGGLQPPSGEGLAPELTRVKTAREFILNVTNFALSFLGLIAVLIIIYGGFLFLTAAGNEEQTGKGKKTITYAVMGILVILVSFALVNTLLKAPTGTDIEAGESRGVALMSTDGRVFSLAALEIRASLETFMKAYENLTVIDRTLGNVKDFSSPRSVSEIRSFLNSVRQAMERVRAFSSPTQESYIAATNVLDKFVHKWLRLSDAELQELIIQEIGEDISKSMPNFNRFPFVPQARAFSEESLKGFYESGSGPLHQAFKEAMDNNFKLSASADLGLRDQPHKQDFQNEINGIRRRLNLVKEGLGVLSDASASDFIRKGITSEEELSKALAGIPPDLTVYEAFEGREGEFDGGLKMLGEDHILPLLENPQNVAEAQRIVQALARLYLVVKDIKFMAVRINANVKEGNAPLSVLFTSIGSLDPSGETIIDNQHEWDLDGDGIWEETQTGCEEKKSASVSCMYQKPGTYRASLRINPKTGVTQVGSGIAVFTIKVNPPKSRIHLEAKAGDTVEVLRKYSADGKLEIAKTAYRITLEEAKAGIVYDASKSTDESANPAGLAMFEWTFGDGSQPVLGATKIIDNPKKTYSKTGTFPLKLEVTDKSNRKDRVIVNITVTSIASRIIAKTLRGDLNTVFEFDGSHSKSDLGAIDSYEWKIFDQDGKEIEGLKNIASDTFRHQFKTPGSYRVKLEVTDKAGNTDQTEAEVMVESQKPKADFEIRGCVIENQPCLDPTQPSLIELDASKSFDPDEGDTISYTWTISDAAAINDFDVIEGSLKDASPEKTKKIKIKFKKTGNFKIILKVEDQHKNEELRQSDVKEKEITAASAVDLAWDPDMVIARNLDPVKGIAVVVFEAKTANADEYDIDFGDTEKLEGEPVIDNTIEKAHAYKKAGNYIVALTARSKEFGSTSAQKRIRIGAGDAPIPVITVEKNGQELFIQNDDEPIIVLRQKDRLTFDARQSINSKGKSEELEYSWNFGDKATSTEARVMHTYEDSSPEDPGYFEVTLVIIEKDEEGETKTSEAKLKVTVTTAKPKLDTLSVAKISQREETPLGFELKAQGANDPDGSITEYTFWYFDETEQERKLSPVTTRQNRAVLTIGTKGQAGEEKRYSFCAELKDNENNVAACEELFPDKKDLPFVIVKNGPNQSPIATITADKTSITIGESITFTAQASDPDGRVAKYVWDVLGDGFHNDAETELSQITQKYAEKSPRSGYRIKLKVIDDKGAEGFSNEIKIFVDMPYSPPFAEFKPEPVGGTAVKFINLSKRSYGSNAELVKFTWDFDANVEYCTQTENACPGCGKNNPLCDHDKTNDPDSTLKNPEFEYPSSGTYEVRLIVEDSNEQKDEKVKSVTIERGRAPKEAEIKAILRVESIDNEAPKKDRDNVYHLKDNGAKVIFYFGDSRGNITEYSLDRNIYFDSGSDAGRGDGITDNDEDFKTNDGSKRSEATYMRNYKTQHPKGYFTARLKVTGKTSDNRVITDTTSPQDDIEGKDAIFVFDPPSGAAAAIFSKLDATKAILLGLAGGVILALTGYFISIIGRKGKTREI